MKYRLLTGSHGRWEKGQNVRYAAGDEIDLSNEEVESFGKRVEPVGGSPVATPAPDKTLRTLPAADKPLGLVDLGWAEAAEIVTTLETVEAVEAARKEEQAGKARKGVLDAVEARLAELEG